MRCVQDKEYGYIFNPWSDGKAAYHNANEGETFKAMEQEGKTNPQIQERVDLFRYRLPEEFYDLGKDPHEMHSVYNDPAYAEVQARLHKQLDELREKYKDKPGLMETFPAKK